jgi:hypothetical protein
LRMNGKDDFRPYWQTEADWLCTVEFLPSDLRFGHHRVPVRVCHLTNTRSLALVGDPDANAYELLFSFSSPKEKKQFLEVRSNPEMGNDYIENDLLSPTTKEIKDARPLAMVLPQDVLNHATLITATVREDTQRDGGIL